MSAKRAGSIWAAQPVTTILAFGRSRRALRIACRAWRTASAVTAQVLTITASVKPGGAGMLAHDFGFVGVQPAAEGDDSISDIAASNMKWVLRRSDSRGALRAPGSNRSAGSEPS